MALADFTKSVASFSWALSVFGVSQAGKVFKGLPTSDPTQSATASNDAVTKTIKEQFDANDNTAFSTVNGVSNALIGLTFSFFTPSTFNPTTILQTSQNVLRWGVGLVTQLIPGGQVGNGGPPVGWGPVNNEDAEIQLPNIQLGGLQASSPQQPVQDPCE